MHTEYCSRFIVLTSLFSFAQGWGKTSSNLNSDFSKVLKQAKMPVVDYQTCAAGNANLSYAKVNDETMLCAGYGGSSVISGCHGDSGGPFVCRERRLWVFRGAVSWETIGVKLVRHSLFLLGSAHLWIGSPPLK